MNRIIFKTVIAQGNKGESDSRCLVRNMRAGRQWGTGLKAWREKTLRPRIQHPVKIPFKNEGEIKIVSDI